MNSLIYKGKCSSKSLTANFMRCSLSQLNSFSEKQKSARATAMVIKTNAMAISVLYKIRLLNIVLFSPPTVSIVIVNVYVSSRLLLSVVQVN